MTNRDDIEQFLNPVRSPLQGFLHQVIIDTLREEEIPAMRLYTDDVDYWVARSKDIELMRQDQALSEEDEQHLQQITTWCKASSLLWDIITRIGWEINEG
jgi:hypothetical protein